MTRRVVRTLQAASFALMVVALVLVAYGCTSVQSQVALPAPLPALVEDYANYPATPEAILNAGCTAGSVVGFRFSVQQANPTTGALGAPSPFVADLAGLPQLNLHDRVTMAWDSVAPECVGSAISLLVKASTQPFFDPSRDQLTPRADGIGSDAGYSTGILLDAGPGTVALDMPDLSILVPLFPGLNLNCAYQIDGIVGVPLRDVGPSGSFFSAGLRQQFGVGPTPPAPGSDVTTVFSSRNSAYSSCAPPTTTTTTAPTTTAPTTTAPTTTAPTTTVPTTVPPTTPFSVPTTVPPSTVPPTTTPFTVPTTVPPTTPPSTGTTVPTTLPETFQLGGATTVCRAEVPTIVVNFGNTFPALAGQTGTLTMADVNGNVVSTQPLVYRPGTSVELLYPGTRVNADGSIADVPGWTLNSSGLWVRDNSDTFLREGIQLTYVLNPTATAFVTYPPETSACANPPTTQQQQTTTTTPTATTRAVVPQPQQPSQPSQPTSPRPPLVNTGTPPWLPFAGAGGLLLIVAGLVLVARTRQRV